MNFIQSLLYQGYFYVNFEFDELEGSKNKKIQHKIIVTKLFLLLFQYAGKMSKKSKLIKKHERVGNLTFLIVKFSF
jgi:hypothetical protein